ncbi:Uncharacterized protein dnl_50350 [Desulfonema limicola]|uniref:Uncharacterized protein n=1 Tax=Desulfonema limicola TaxID=45656 RepID=A0A975BCB7_9BACT|nr:Uncharacterized protein dnl_50350 [Desulfonema limicola]
MWLPLPCIFLPALKFSLILSFHLYLYPVRLMAFLHQFGTEDYKKTDKNLYFLLDIILEKKCNSR